MTPAFVLFIALLVGSAAFVEWTIIHFAFNGALATVLMWSVGLSAILALKLSGRDLSSLGWKWGAARYHAIAFLLPALYGGAAYFAADAAGLAEFPRVAALQEIGAHLGFGSLSPAMAMTAALAVALTAGFVSNMSSALGEEIGWRGFLTPRLTDMTGFVRASLLTGLLWASWHMPLLIWGGYNSGGEQAYELASFAVMITAMSGAMAWLRLSSGSLWPAATLHASHNLLLQTIYDPMTVRGDGPVTITGEFGVATAIAAVFICLPFWIAGMRLTKTAR